MASDTATAPQQGSPKATGSALQADLLSGFLVFLIALPLCLGIARASGFPVFSGIITAIIGGVLVTFLGGAPMTIKGPAAGLIVIAVGCITALTSEAAATGLGDEAAAHLGYQWALAVVAVTGVIQALMGLLKAGKLGDFFPTTVVHGMLAAIGIIIIAKQAHVMMGISMPATLEPFQLYLQLPHSFSHMNTNAFIIAVVSLAILYGWLFIKNPTIKKIPAPLVVVLVSVPLGYVLDMGSVTDHTTEGVHYGNGLVTITGSLAQAITFPRFDHLMASTSLYYTVMFVGVGSIESLLSAKAVESLDPQRRPTDLNRDLFGVGVGNALCGLLGGLPMIAEIVRSSANLNNGAKTRMANFWHGIFLLAFVAAAPSVIHLIPSSALAAMLVYTGTRLASPMEFAKTYKIGGEQLLIFCVTAVGCVGIDLLAGVGMGIVTKYLVHLVNGVPVGSLFSARPEVKVDAETDTATITLHGAAIFSNYLGIKSTIVAQTAKHVILDVSDCRLVDHSVMEHVHELEAAFKADDRTLVMRGLGDHKGLSDHPMAARKKTAPMAAAA